LVFITSLEKSLQRNKNKTKSNVLQRPIRNSYLLFCRRGVAMKLILASLIWKVLETLLF
jgi:hypothetical protein